VTNWNWIKFGVGFLLGFSTGFTQENAVCFFGYYPGVWILGPSLSWSKFGKIRHIIESSSRTSTNCLIDWLLTGTYAKSHGRTSLFVRRLQSSVSAAGTPVQSHATTHRWTAFHLPGVSAQVRPATSSTETHAAPLRCKVITFVDARNSAISIA